MSSANTNIKEREELGTRILAMISEREKQPNWEGNADTAFLLADLLASHIAAGTVHMRGTGLDILTLKLMLDRVQRMAEQAFKDTDDVLAAVARKEKH